MCRVSKKEQETFWLGTTQSFCCWTTFRYCTKPHSWVLS